MLNFYIKEKENKMMNNETGRSMVEMLGVLAIIGVLSVGGIAGYTMAMRKYKANEILNTASMLSMLARSADGGVGKALDLTNAGLEPPFTGVTMEATATGAINVYGTNDEDICNVVETSGNTSIYEIKCSKTAKSTG